MTRDVTSFENHNIEEAAIASVISQLASISSLEEEQRMALKPDLTMGSSGSSALLLLTDGLYFFKVSALL